MRHHHRGIDGRRHFIFRAQTAVVARPLLRHLEVLTISADLVAQYRDFHAIGGIVEVEIALLPGVTRGRCGGAAQTSELSTNSSDAGSRWICVRRKSSASVRAPRQHWHGARGIFGQLVFEANQLAAGRYVDTEFFFLLRAEPTIRPAPQPHRRSHDPVGFVPVPASRSRKILAVLSKVKLAARRYAFDAVLLVR